MTEDKKEKQEAKQVEVPSEYARMIELEDKTIVDTAELLVRIYNKILKIEKSIA